MNQEDQIYKKSMYRQKESINETESIIDHSERASEVHSKQDLLTARKSSSMMSHKMSGSKR